VPSPRPVAPLAGRGAYAIRVRPQQPCSWERAPPGVGHHARGARHSVFLRNQISPNAGALSSHEDWESCARCPTHGEQILLGCLPQGRLAAERNATRARCTHRLPEKSDVDSRPAIIFNSRCAPIMANRSRQASMVRAFFIATSNTCVRLSIIAPIPASVPLSLAPAPRTARWVNEKYPVDGPTGAGAGHALGAGRAWLWSCDGTG